MRFNKFIATNVVAVTFFLFFMSCSSNKVSEQNQASDSLKMNTELESNNSAWDDSLKKYFTPEQIVKVKQARADFDKIKTATDLATFYLVTLDTVKNIVYKQIQVSDHVEYSGDATPDAHWKWFNDYLPAIKCEVLCSECEYQPNTNLIPLAEKAKQTPEKEDDIYFELALAIENPENRKTDVVYEGGGDFATLISCDICGASLLGSGYRYKVLQSIEKAASARSLFNGKIESYLDQALSVNDIYFYYDKAKVIAELDQLLGRVADENRKKALQEARGRINAEKDQYGNTIQFDCGKNNGLDCTWEGA